MRMFYVIVGVLVAGSLVLTFKWPGENPILFLFLGLFLVGLVGRSLAHAYGRSD